MSNTYLYIPNNDGSVRWAWPLESKEALFLNFYNSSTWKQKIFRLAVKLIFMLRLQRFVFRKSDEIQLISVPLHKEWALFYGTPGQNNKLVLFQKFPNGNSNFTNFTKIAESETAKHLIEKEKSILTDLSKRENNFSFELL